MAYYYPVFFWYRGRLLKATLRYDCYMHSFEILKGKPFMVTARDHRRIEKLIERKPGIARQADAFHEVYSRL